MIVDYLRLSVWPVKLVAFYGWPQPLTVAQVATPLAFVATLVAATIVTVLGAPSAGFLGVWFFGILAPTSSIVPIATEVGAERRMYLPLVAVIVLVVLAYGGSSGRGSRWRVAVVLAAVLAVEHRRAEPRVRLTGCRWRRRSSSAGPRARRTTCSESNWRTLAAWTKRWRSCSGLWISATRGRVFSSAVSYLAKGDVAAARPQLEAVVKQDGVRQPLRWLEPPAIEVLTARLLLGQLYAANRRWPEAEAQARAVLAGCRRTPMPGVCWRPRSRGSSDGPSRSPSTGSTCSCGPGTRRRGSTSASRWWPPASSTRR